MEGGRDQPVSLPGGSSGVWPQGPGEMVPPGEEAEVGGGELATSLNTAAHRGDQLNETTLLLADSTAPCVSCNLKGHG